MTLLCKFYYLNHRGPYIRWDMLSQQTIILLVFALTVSISMRRVVPGAALKIERLLIRMPIAAVQTTKTREIEDNEDQIAS